MATARRTRQRVKAKAGASSRRRNVRDRAVSSTDSRKKKTPAGEHKDPAGVRVKELTRADGPSHAKSPERKPKKDRASGRGGRGRRELSRHPEAVRSRKRRRYARRVEREEIGVRDQLAYERSQREERARRKRKKIPLDERELALSWLEEIRNVISSVFRCSLSTTEAVSSNSSDEGREPSDRQRENMRTPWLAVGRYDPVEPIGYAQLAQAFDLVRIDLTLEAVINPQRLSQIRVVFSDPNATRGEGDSIVSKIGAWEFIVAELVREIGGSGDDDEDALVNRYQATKIPMFYIYFSSDVGGGGRNVWKTWGWKIR